jgi:hypothetical protein
VTLDKISVFGFDKSEWSVDFFEQSGAPFAFVESKDADLVQCHRMQKRFHHVEHEREDFGS